MTVLSRVLPTSRRCLPLGSVSGLQYRYAHGKDGGGQQYQHDTNSTNKYAKFAMLAAIGAGGLMFTGLNIRKVYADSSAFNMTPPERKDLPTFKREDVKKHNKNAQRIWVSYKNGVYDVTEFVTKHPGGDKILFAAGGPVEPFWSLYAQHKTKEVQEILETLRIGNLDPKEVAELKSKDKSDPFSTDPHRHPALIVNNETPFNAETPPSLLVDSFRTPNDLFFVRNHLPVPQVDVKRHRLSISGLGLKKSIEYSVEELRSRFKPTHVTSVVQCAGNRRAEMNKYKKVQGLMWTGTAISNAKWTGVKLRDLLLVAGVDPKDPRIKHVHFEGADTDPTGTRYGASIPFEKAMSEETIVAYEMNDEPIPPDHGAPLRVIVPGNVGARQVKWLSSIHLSEEESRSHWQQKDYRVFSPGVNMGDELKWNEVQSIQEYPIQSAFCTPAPNSTVHRADGTVDVSGYAWSGGGRGIIRVEISPDGGKTWQSAELEQDHEQDIEHMWAWTLFKASVKIPEGVDRLDLVVKATDRAYNTQPETATGIWNVRGLLHNAWHRVEVTVTA